MANVHYFMVRKGEEERAPSPGGTQRPLASVNQRLGLKGSEIRDHLEEGTATPQVEGPQGRGESGARVGGREQSPLCAHCQASSVFSLQRERTVSTHTLSTSSSTSSS